MQPSRRADVQEISAASLRVEGGLGAQFVHGTTNWQFLQTVTGNGSVQSCVIPMTNTAHRFFRVRQP